MATHLEPGRQYEVGQLLQELPCEAGVRIALDRLDIYKGILKINQKVTFDDWQTHDQPLEVILREVTHSLERPHPTDPFDTIPRVVITQEHGRIVLTSRPLPFEPLRVRVYTLPAAMPEGAVLTSAELSDDIQLSVDIDSWDDVGGPGSIARDAGDGCGLSNAVAAQADCTGCGAADEPYLGATFANANPAVSHRHGRRTENSGGPRYHRELRFSKGSL